MSADKPLTVADLIRALGKLPPSAPLVHYSVYYDGLPNLAKMMTEASVKEFGLYTLADEDGRISLCTEYDCEQWKRIELDFSEDDLDVN